MHALALVLADSRFPGGGHVHSGGLEEAAARGMVRAEADLPAFLHGRLRTAGELAAVFAAAAAHAAARGPVAWSVLDAELDARTPSAAQRAASRAQGRATARAARAMLLDGPFPAVSPPHRCPVTELLATTPHPHHAVILGALVGASGGGAHDAALVAAYLSVSGPASAAVRLLGLDPLVVNAVVAGLATALHEVADRAAGAADHEPAALPSPGAPGLDLLAEEHDRHHTEEVRLFAS